MGDVDFNIDSNADQIAKDMAELGNNTNKSTRSFKDADSASAKFGKTLQRSLGAFAVGSLFHKGIKAITQDIIEANRQTKALAITTRGAFGQGGAALITQARDISKRLKFDQGRAATLLQGIQGAAGVATAAQQARVAEQAIRVEQGKDIPAEQIANITLKAINNSPEFFKGVAGADKAINTLLIGAKAGDITPESFGALADVFSTAVFAGVDPQKAVAEFSASTVTGKNPAETATAFRALFNKFAVSEDRTSGASLGEFAGRISKLPESEQVKALGSEEAVKGLLAMTTNAETSKRILAELRASGARDIPKEDLTRLLQDQRQFSAFLSEASRVEKDLINTQEKGLKSVDTAAASLSEMQERGQQRLTGLVSRPEDERFVSPDGLSDPVQNIADFFGDIVSAALEGAGLREGVSISAERAGERADVAAATGGRVAGGSEGLIRELGLNQANIATQVNNAAQATKDVQRGSL